MKNLLLVSKNIGLIVIALLLSSCSDYYGPLVEAPKEDIEGTILGTIFFIFLITTLIVTIRDKDPNIDGPWKNIIAIILIVLNIGLYILGWIINAEIHKWIYPVAFISIMYYILISDKS